MGVEGGYLIAREGQTSDEAALLGVALAGIIALFLGPGPWGWMSTVVGITLIAVLCAYDPLWTKRTKRPGKEPLTKRPGKEPLRRHIAFSCVYGLCAIVSVGVYEEVYEQFFAATPQDRFSDKSGADMVCRSFTADEQIVPIRKNTAIEQRCVEEAYVSLVPQENPLVLIWMVMFVVVMVVRCVIDRRLHPLPLH